MFSFTGTFLVAAWLGALALSFYVVRDAFSPDKLALVSLAVYFGDIFFHEYSITISVVYFILILSFVTVVVVFAPFLRFSRMTCVAIAPSGTSVKNGVPFVRFRWFWLVSLPALAAQVWMIQSFGGIEGYLNSLELRVVEFRGFGPLVVLIQTFSVINLIYFSFLILRPERRVRDVAIYGLHLVIFVVMALLTSGRGSLLVNFVLMMLVYHHSVRRIGVHWLITVAAGLLLIASVLEVARRNVSFDGEVLTTGISDVGQAEEQATFEWAKYGLIPLEILLEADNVNRYYGLTYLTVFTNIIPRELWSAKPDTGGVVLTKEYTGDAWGGFSNLSTGIIPEAIINFGRPLGIVVGTLQFGILVGALLLYYVRYRRRVVKNDPSKSVDSVRFSYITWGMAALIIGEFTNIVVNLVVQLTTVWIVYQLIGMMQPQKSWAAA